MTTEPLDVESLLGELDDPGSEPFDGLPGGTTMGHVHLQVAEIESTVGFYRDLLGFGLMAQLGDSAAFLAAGGYHHHLGANTWESRGASPPPAGTAALRHATIVLPDDAARDRVLDRLAASRPRRRNRRARHRRVRSVRQPAGALDRVRVTRRRNTVTGA